jgi:hypothetical protein
VNRVFILLAAGALGLLVGATPAQAALSDGRQSFIAVGGHFAQVYHPSETATGFTAAFVFRPDGVAQFSRTLADHGLGLGLAYNRSVLSGSAVVEGMEFTARRYFARDRDSWHPFLAMGLGQNQVKPAGGGSRSIWSAVLGVGSEWDLSSRWLIQLELTTRTVEFSNDSYTMSALTLTFGARIDS